MKDKEENISNKKTIKNPTSRLKNYLLSTFKRVLLTNHGGGQYHKVLSSPLTLLSFSPALCAEVNSRTLPDLRWSYFNCTNPLSLVLKVPS